MNRLREIIQSSCAELALAEPTANATRIPAGKLDDELRKYFNGRLGQSSRASEAGYLNSSDGLFCLTSESYRTQLYQAALLDAVKQCLERKGSCRVAYIGTGPAATLALRLMTELPSDGVSITFIEGHDNSHTLVEKFLADLNFTPFVENVLNVNAMSREGKEAIGAGFDVVIIETMNQALLSEKQAHITLNLGKEILSEGGVWLPGSVDISVQSSRRSSFNRMPFYSLKPEGVIGHSEEFGFDPDAMRVSGEFDIGLPPSRSDYLTVHTEINLDRSRTLRSGRSVITAPWILSTSQLLPRFAKVSYLLGGKRYQENLVT